MFAFHSASLSGHREMTARHAEPGALKHLAELCHRTSIEIYLSGVGEPGFDFLVSHRSELSQNAGKVGFEIIANGIKLNAEW